MARTCILLVALVFPSNSTFADSDSLEAAKQALQHTKDNGRSPSFQEFVVLVNRQDVQLDRQEFFQLHAFLGELQGPEISREALAKKITTKQEQIKEYVADLRVKEEGEITPDTGYLSQRFALVSSGSHHLARQFIVSPNGDETIHRIISYDGLVVRRFDGESRLGEIKPLEEEHRYELLWPGVNPNATSMLLNTKVQLGEENDDADLAAMLKSPLTVLLEERQEIDGHSCLVVSKVSTVAYLDPELDYSVIRRETWTYDSDESSGLHRRNWVTRYTDYQDYGDGILFPEKVIRQNTSNGRRNVITIEELSVNGGVPDNVFQVGIFPKGTETIDWYSNETFFSDGKSR